jgi:uncharacterized iron-regulated membrane protein
MMPLRRWWLHLHAWLGAIAAIVFLVVGTSGATLVFMDDLLRWQLGEMASSESAADWRPPAAFESAARGHMGDTFEPYQLYYPESLLKISAAFYYGVQPDPATQEPVEWLVFMDPATARVQGAAPLESLWADTLLHFHIELLAGETGGLLVALCGIILAVSSLSAILLWWPNAGVLRKLSAWRLSGPLRQKLFRLHSVAGIFSAILLLMLTVTGTRESQPQWFRAVAPDALADVPHDTNRVRQNCTARAALDAAVEQFIATDGARQPSIFSPAHSEGPAHLRMKGPTDTDQFYGDSYAWFDCSGLIAERQHGEWAGNWLSLAAYTLHAGRFWGPLGPVLVFIGGIALALLTASGVYLFWKRYVRAAGA